MKTIKFNGSWYFVYGPYGNKRAAKKARENVKNWELSLCIPKEEPKFTALQNISDKEIK